MQTEHLQLVQTGACTGKCRKPGAERLRTAIVYAALVVIAVLAVPMCIFLGAIMLVWSLADKIIQKLGSHTR